MNLIQLVAVGACTIQIRGNSTVQHNHGIRFRVAIMRRILLTVYYTAFIRILTLFIRILIAYTV